MKPPLLFLIIVFAVSGTATISEPLESPPFLTYKDIKIEQFNDMLRSNKKDTKIRHRYLSLLGTSYRKVSFVPLW